MISKHRFFPTLVVALAAVAAFPSCKNTDPGAAGEPCNFDAPGTDGCDAISACIGGTCYATCSSPSKSSSECAGGGCVAYVRADTGQTFNACFTPTGGGGPGPSGTGTSNPGCTPSCVGRACGGDGCGGSCGTCPSGNGCTSNGTCVAGGGGGGGSGCVNVNPYISAHMSTSPYCKDYVAITNGYSHQIACKYTTSNGKSGCVLPVQGANECAFWLEGAASYSMVCADGQLACDQAIGCSL